MDIHVEMHLSYETDVWAYGMVTLENIIRFPVQLRKFKNKDTGEETSFLSYPRRERCGKWENILVPEKKLREEIEKAVGEKIKEEMRKDLYLPEIEILSISPIVPRYPPNAKAYICGVASVQLLGLTINGITIKKGQRGYFINMPQYKSSDGYHDVIYAIGKAMQKKISECVLQEYQKIMGVSNFGTEGGLTK